MKNPILWIDFETRSRCNLLTRGVYNYAKDPSTEVICMAYAFGDEAIKLWTPDYAKAGWGLPHEVANFKGQIRARNAAFERLIFWHVLGVNFKLEQFYCTATESRGNCTPGSLADAARFAGASMKKDHRGSQLIQCLSIPAPDGSFCYDPILLKEMYDYCVQDVAADRATSKCMRQLSDEELHDYHVNERINDLGVLIDYDLCKAAVQYAGEEKKEIETLVLDITRGEIKSVRSPKMRKWIFDHVGDSAKKLMEIYKDGKKKTSIDKNVRANLLALAEEDSDQVSNDVADVIQCADDLWASSVAKFNRLAELADLDDNRVRGAFVFAGAVATGRAASYGAQVHNFARKCAEDPGAVRNAMCSGLSLTPEYGPCVTAVLKGMLRPALIPSEGKQLVAADWSAIEGRIGPWLANSIAGNEKLDIYRSGLDPYKTNAVYTYRVEYEKVTDEQRQVGKIQELALGFCGGVGTFKAFSGKIKMAEADIVTSVAVWRRANPWAFEHGRALEKAYKSAMRHRGREFSGGRTTYMFDGQHLWYSLPSGRILCYPFAKLDSDGVSYAKASWKPAVDAKEWPRGRLWLGLAVANCVQATANDLLRHALREMDDRYFDIVLHVHDEIVVETDHPEEVTEVMTKIMTMPPTWCNDLPLDVKIQTLNRYGKG